MRIQDKRYSYTDIDGREFEVWAHNAEAAAALFREWFPKSRNLTASSVKEVVKGPSDVNPIDSGTR